MANQTYRVLELIKRFNNKETAYISRLKEEVNYQQVNEILKKIGLIL